MKKLMYLLVAGSLSVFTACDGGEPAKEGTPAAAADTTADAADKKAPADKAPKAAPADKKEDKKEEAK